MSKKHAKKIHADGHSPGDSGQPGKDSKKNTSLRLDKQTLKALKIHAIENDTSIQKLIEQLIVDYLAKSK